MSVAMKLSYKRDINDPLVTQAPVTLLMQGDNQANVIELTLMDGATPASLSGYTATVYLQRADGVRVRCPGSVSGNVATVPLQAECYSVPGQYAAIMKLSGPNEIRTVLRLAGYVESDGQGVIIDPSGSIPSYEDLERIVRELEEALRKAETATSSANAAAQNATTAAGSANTAAGAANTAARNATTATSRANTAAASIEGLTVEASDVAYNQPATATVTDVKGHKHIAFGLRQGVPGAVPNITFTGETGEPNTDVVVTQSGTPESPVVNLKIPQGVPGTGNVSTVDGVGADSGGNVALSAVRYVAQTLEDAQKVQARKNIGVDGQIYPCTASALEALSSSDLVGIYNQGYRAIKTENNGTVVLLGLAADGSLEWLGCNQPRENLLDNPDFAIAQAGYGGTHGAQVYAADMWKGSGTGATFAAGSGGGLSITCGTGAAGCSQVVAEPPSIGAYFSFVVVVGGVPLIASGTWTGTAQDATATSGALTATVTAGSVQISVASGSVTVDYCMLLIGSYTPKTLPPWEPPDSVSKMTKCRQFYRSLSAYGFVGIAIVDADNSVQGVIFGEQMRISNPSILGAFTVYTPTSSTNITVFNSVSYQGNGFRFSAQTTGGMAIGTIGILAPVPNSGAISADI